MPFTGGYKSETDHVHHCYINQFGIYFHDDDHDDEHDGDHDGDMLNIPSQGTDWRRSCMEAKYRTFVTLQQMVEFAFIGGLGCFFFSMKSKSIPFQMKQLATMSQSCFQTVWTMFATHKW